MPRLVREGAAREADPSSRARRASSMIWRIAGATYTPSRLNRASAPTRTPIRSVRARPSSMTTSGVSRTQHSPPFPSKSPPPKASVRTTMPIRAARSSSSTSRRAGVTGRTVNQTVSSSDAVLAEQKKADAPRDLCQCETFLSKGGRNRGKELRTERADALARDGVSSA